MNLRNVGYDFTAVILILALPFVEFAYTNRFIFELANVYILAGYAMAAIVIALLINKFPNRIFRSLVFTAIIVLFLDARIDIIRVVGLETVFIAITLLGALWLIYLKSTTILIAVFGGMFAGIFLLDTFPTIENYPVNHAANSSQTADLPVYVHIVLDEHIGLEALDDAIGAQKELKQSAMNLYIDNGFRLFGRAYSEYYDTFDSLSATLNSYRGLNPEKFYAYHVASDTYEFAESKYLRDLRDSGYNIQIYQNAFINFCNQSKDIIQKCLTYNSFNISSQALKQLDTGEKLEVILTKFGFVYSKRFFHKAYTSMAKFSVRNGLSLPIWDLPTATDMGPVPVLPVFDQLIADVVSAPAGSMFFAHLLLPHSPYAVDGRCNIRTPAANWKRTMLPDRPSDGRENTPYSRAERYDEYIEQTECAVMKVGELVEAMQQAGKFEDSIIIIHGDHGARINLYRPYLVTKDKLVRQDYYDAFATLFAVKAPHIAAGYDLRMLPIERLLRHAEGGEAIDQAPPEEHFVFLYENTPPSTFIKVPMPDIPIASNTRRGAND